jgi:hypothetical protein
MGKNVLRDPALCLHQTGRWHTYGSVLRQQVICHLLFYSKLSIGISPSRDGLPQKTIVNVAQGGQVSQRENWLNIRVSLSDSFADLQEVG